MVAVDPAFALALMKEIAANACNYFTDNRDGERFGRAGLLRSVRDRVGDRALAALTRRFDLTLRDKQSERATAEIDGIQAHLGGLSRLYDSLADEHSKSLLVKLIAFRILGYRRVKLPLNTPEYWRKRKEINKLIARARTIPTGFLGWHLSLFKLHDLGYNLEVLSTLLGILDIFVLKQYELARPSVSCKAQNGDFVIDAGACWGDSSLYFAGEVGETGKVYSFEFLPGNLEIVRQNIGLNPHLRDRIEIIERPLWDVSDQPLYCTDDGPASRVTTERGGTDAITVRTLCLDDFVDRHKVKKVDFIKMDIEGAEVNALRGAANTIRRFRPKLAISIYHDLGDFTRIPALLSSLAVGYDFYLDHYTIHAEETILYGVPRIPG